MISISKLFGRGYIDIPVLGTADTERVFVKVIMATNGLVVQFYSRNKMCGNNMAYCAQFYQTFVKFNESIHYFALNHLIAEHMKDNNICVDADTKMPTREEQERAWESAVADSLCYDSTSIEWALGDRTPAWYQEACHEYEERYNEYCDRQRNMLLMQMYQYI